MSLNLHSRAAAIERMTSSEPLDVLVIGGGVVGGGVALDAVTRGLSTGLIEARDYASGTSSRSSKLIHGGLRYLEMLDFGLVHEALQERGLLLAKIAPHLVRPVSFMYPLSKPAWERFYVGSGVALYDGLAFGVRQTGGLPRHRHLRKKNALQLMPSLKPSALSGAIQYYDAQVDDARFVLELIRTAAQHGAHVANRVKAEELLRDDQGRVVGVVAVDDMSSDPGRARFEIHARHVISATGVWTGEIQEMLDGDGPLSVTASKGVHLVVPKDRIDSSTGVILRTEKSVLFIIPWGEHWIIGTTDTPWKYDKAHPAATSADIDYLLSTVNEVLVTPLTREDIDGVYVGLRPLIAPTEPADVEATTRISREHVVASPVPGLVIVAGGKYTTYRVMAKDAVDLALEELGKEMPESISQTIPLAGAINWDWLSERPHILARSTDLDVMAIENLLERYGTLTTELLALIAVDPTLGEVLPGGEEHLKVEIVYAAAAEGALHLTDALTRRTRISIEARDRGLTAAEPAARLMAPILGWDEDRISYEIDLYRRRVEAEMSSQTMPDDESSHLARSAVRETTLS
ncbi:MAG: glycerol-3-phosphate dehydrogenase/oxidase [Actinomycetales bacterium]|nr:glycerol-3-phosphate dehydrogenase/oxidase [Actinomycetales bacterium]